MEKNFANLELSDDILKGVYLYGFKEPSPIQIKGINSINTGKDCILQSQSGTGKTATYLLGIINKINKSINKIQAVIILPTRELAKQVLDVAEQFVKFSDIKIIKCIGGTEFNSMKGHLVIGTLGRINHMIKIRKINIKTIQRIVIDEADQLFVENNIDKSLIYILDNLNDNIQIILISLRFII